MRVQVGVKLLNYHIDCVLKMQRIAVAGLGRNNIAYDIIVC